MYSDNDFKEFDRILSVLNDSTERQLTVNVVGMRRSFPGDEYLDKLFGEGLIIFNDIPSMVNITPKGRKIINDGGFEKYHKNEQKKITDEEEAKNEQREKIQWDIKLAKIKYYTWWISLLLSTIALFFSVLSYYTK